jgi:dnd system-associated protein 4
VRTFRHNHRFEPLVDLLYGKPLKKANNQPIFATKRDLLCFAAVLGFEEDRHGPIEAKAVDFVDSRPFENSQEAMNLLYLIGLAVTKDADALREENEEKLVEIFEQFADGGLSVIQEWLAETPSDPHGDRAILEALKKHGYLGLTDEPAEDVVADVEF